MTPKPRLIDRDPTIRVVILAAFLISFEWFGVFEWVERFFDRPVWAKAKIYPGGQILFFESESGRAVSAVCRRRCRDQIGLVVDGLEYRLIVTDLPLLDQRIVKIEHYPDPTP